MARVCIPGDHAAPDSGAQHITTLLQHLKPHFAGVALSINSETTLHSVATQCSAFKTTRGRDCECDYLSVLLEPAPGICVSAEQISECHHMFNVHVVVDAGVCMSRGTGKHKVGMVVCRRV